MARIEIDVPGFLNSENHGQDSDIDPLGQAVFGDPLHAALNRDARHAQDVSHFGFLQARSVIFEGQAMEVLINAEAAQTVGIGELTEGAELFGAQRALQFVGDFDQGHAWIIATSQGR